MDKELWNFCTARQRTDMELSFYPGQNDFLATLSDSLGYIKTEGYKNPKAFFILCPPVLVRMKQSYLLSIFLLKILQVTALELEQFKILL